MCAVPRFEKPRSFPERERVVTFCVVQKVTKKHARTCKKLPVASFCASETAETGRIANGREQGDHVSRRQGGKGFNFVSGKLLFEWAASRFGEPRSSFWEGFNFVSEKLVFGRAASRFGEPRSSRKGNVFILFACTKRTKSTPEGCDPLDSGDDSNLRSIHGFCENDRPSSCNRPRRVFQPFRVSTVRI